MSSRLKGLAAATIVLGWFILTSPSYATMALSGMAVSSLDSGVSAATTPTPPSNCQPTWQIVDTPSSPAFPNGFGGVTAISTNDVWAVGSFFTGTLTEHWDGSSWRFVPAYTFGEGSGFTQVAALASNDMWAVGLMDSQNTLTEHWDGQGWQYVPSPSAGANLSIQALTAIATDDVWMVGSADQSAEQTFAEHWNGRAWAIIPSANINPPGGQLPNGLSGLAATSTNDVWAVGDYIDSTGPIWSLVEHWDGVSWKVVPVPHFGDSERLYAVAAIAPDDAWAVGNYSTGNAIALLALHWDGVSWRKVDMAYPSPGDYFDLRALLALSPTNVWAAGYYAYHGVPDRTLIEHWDGTSWRVVPSPSDNYADSLFSLAAVSSSDVWAVGERYPTNPDTLALHYTTPPGCPTLTPTNTPTARAIPTFTPAPSATPTPTASATPALLPSASMVASPTALPNATVTPTTLPQATATPLPSLTTTAPPAASATPCGQSYPDVPTEYWAYGYIRYLSCHAIVSGYPDGLFRPDNPISRAEFSKMLALGYGLQLLTPAQPSFADVPPGFWAYTYIESLHAAGTISGYPDGSFHPYASISRAEMVKMNVLASGVPAYTGVLADYPDVPPGYWAYGYIKTATYKQWVGGYSDGRFHPASDASRAELSKVLFLSLSYPRR